MYFHIKRNSRPSIAGSAGLPVRIFDSTRQLPCMQGYYIQQSCEPIDVKDSSPTAKWEIKGAFRLRRPPSSMPTEAVTDEIDRDIIEECVYFRCFKIYSCNN